MDIEGKQKDNNQIQGTQHKIRHIYYPVFLQVSKKHQLKEISQCFVFYLYKKL